MMINKEIIILGGGMVGLAIAYQIEYLNLKEIFKYSSLKTIYRWPLNYLSGNLIIPEYINLNISQENLLENMGGILASHDG